MIVEDPIYKHIGVEEQQQLNSITLDDPMDYSIQINLLPLSNHSHHPLFRWLTFGLYSAACFAAFIGVYCAFFGQVKHKSTQDISTARRMQLCLLGGFLF
jgi:hypothetical protein